MWLRLFVFLYRRGRPREGWLILGLVLWAVTIAPSAARDIGWVPGLGRLIPVAMAATLLGLALARSPFGGRLSALLSAILGAEFVVAFIARVVPPWGLLLREAGYAFRWLSALAQGEIGRVPFLPVAEAWWARAWDFGIRFSVWIEGVRRGGAQQDNLLFLVFSGWLVWGVGAWAGWWVFRRRQALVAMLPAGVLLAVNVFFAGTGEGWAIAFVAALLMLLVGLHYRVLEERWAQQSVDYSEEIRVGVYAAGLAISVIILVLMPVVPTVTSRRLADAFWELVSSPWREVERSAERMFPELERPAASPLRVGLGGSPDRMPRVHLLGGSPELSRRQALRVRLSEPPPQYGGQKFYYRAITYAEYSGRGWSNPPDLEQRMLPPGEPWDVSVEAPVGRRRIFQSVELLQAPGSVLYTVGEPIAPDVPYRARLRAPGALVSILAEGRRPRRYSVISAVPAVSEAQLRAAGRDYPPAIREIYLALPEIPPRVITKTMEIVAGIDNPYDQAVAIERFLRQFEYTLDLDEPPPGRDAVDYFLFDLQKGYCDYYASAMVVMARLVGIPARLAVGYASGFYDELAGEFTVTEAEAHSWPELYFPPYGWIPFEPTAARSTFERVGLSEADGSQEAVGIAPSPLRGARWRLISSRWWQGLGLLGALALVLGVGYFGWLHHRRRILGPVAMAYDGLVWWGRRLGEGHSQAETPQEHASLLAQRLERIVQAARYGRGWLRRWQRDASADVMTIAAAYTEEVYGGRPLPDAKRRQVDLAWRRLRGKLWAFWAAHRL